MGLLGVGKRCRTRAVEPSIAHAKEHERQAYNRLNDAAGDAINALLSAAGMNLSKIIKALRALLSLLALLHTWLKWASPADSFPDPLGALLLSGFFQNRLVSSNPTFC